MTNAKFETILAEIIDLNKKVNNRKDLIIYSEKLCLLASMILYRRLGDSFTGIYPFCGLDVLTPYLLGGKWLLFDESWRNYQVEISKYNIPYFEDGLNSDRIRIIEKTMDDSKEEIISFKPNVVLIKYAGEGNYERIFNFLIKNPIKLPLVLIVCTHRQVENYIDQSSIYTLSSIELGSIRNISLTSQLQPPYQTFFFLDRLKLYELTKK